MTELEIAGVQLETAIGEGRNEQAVSFRFVSSRKVDKQSALMDSYSPLTDPCKSLLLSVFL